MKVSKPAKDDVFTIEFEHQKQQIYHVKRQDLLLSFDYKRTKEGYYHEEILEFLDKLDKEEVEIAGLFRDHDKQGMHGAGGMEEIKRQLQYEENEGLKIGNKDLDEDKHVEDGGDYEENSYYDN